MADTTPHFTGHLVFTVADRKSTPSKPDAAEGKEKLAAIRVVMPASSSALCAEIVETAGTLPGETCTSTWAGEIRSERATLSLKRGLSNWLTSPESVIGPTVP